MSHDQQRKVENLMESGLKRITDAIYGGKLIQELADKLEQLEKDHSAEFKSGTEDEQGEYTACFYHNFMVAVFKNISEEVFTNIEYAPLLEDELGELYGIQTS